MRLRFPIPTLSTLSDAAISSIATRRSRRAAEFATRDIFGRIGTTSGDDLPAASITIRKEVAVVAYAREEHRRFERAISLPRSEAPRQKKTGLSSRGASLSSVSRFARSLAPSPRFQIDLTLPFSVSRSSSVPRFEDYPSMIIKIVPKSERLRRSILRRQLQPETRIQDLAF